MTRHFSQPSETATSTDLEIAFDHYDPEDERRRESLLSLGNGVYHCRASAPEEVRSEAHYPGLYRAGCYARLEGTVEDVAVSTDSLANLPNWLDLSFRLGEGGEWLSFDRVEILRYDQRLDLNLALLTREVTFRDASGRQSEFREERFVSMASIHSAGLRTTLRPLDWSGRVEIRSGIDAEIGNELAVTEGGYNSKALTQTTLQEFGGCLVAETRTLGTEVEIAVALRSHVTHAGQGTPPGSIEKHGHSIAQYWALDVTPGRVIEVEKVAALFTSRDHAATALPDAAVVAVTESPTYAVLRQNHILAWSQLWGRCRVEIEDENLSRATNLHAFHLIQTASPHAALSHAGLPSRGWQEAYHGQIFWDETLSLSFLSMHMPDVARSILIHRHRRLDAARAAARMSGLAGALYLWRSGTIGDEETPEYQQNPKSGRWHRDDTRFQYHVGSAIAHNVWRYFVATRDTDFMVGYGAEMMVEIARMWASLAKSHPNIPERLTIRGVVGPNEFHTRYPNADRIGLDDETYTNIMAAWTLLRAGDVIAMLPAHHRDAVLARLMIDQHEPAQWADVAARLNLPVGPDGVFLPFDRYEDLESFDMTAFEHEHPGERLDWFIEAQGRDINALQVQKQATFAMLVHLLSAEELTGLLDTMGYPVTPEVIRRTLDADLDRTSHDSSLSDLIYAGAFARLAPEQSWEMFTASMHPDEKSGHSGTEKGVHLGAMGATLDILQRIYVGVRPTKDGLEVDPAPPPHLGRVCLYVLFCGNSVVVENSGLHLRVTADESNHSPVPLHVLGEKRVLDPGKSCFVDLPPAEPMRDK